MNNETFKRYMSIENAYNTKHINGQLNRHPEVAGCKWGVQEKIDGSNYNITITPYDIIFGKRKSFIDHSGGLSFQGDLSVITTDEYQQLFKDIQSLGYDKVILYGELYGEGIQRRIHYCIGKRVKFYDIVIDGVYLSVKDFYDFMDKIEYTHLTVPLIAVCDTLNDALGIPNEYPSKVVENFEWGDYHVCEGNLIKPFDISCPALYIKNKNDKFADKMKTKKRKVNIIEDVPENVSILIDEFESYCTRNRLLDLFSKDGVIEDASQIGVYIKMMMQDMIADYLKDNMEQHKALDQKWQKKIVNSNSKLIVNMLKEYL